MRRTKIVATLGPSSSDEETLRRMLDAGLDVARLNFSHGTHEGHRQNCELVRRLAANYTRSIGIMVDLQGPKIRTGEVGPPGEHRQVRLEEGTPFLLTTRPVIGDETQVSTTYEHLPQDVKPGDCIYIADGTIELEVQRVDGPDVHCIVLHGGLLSDHKGINLPGVPISAPTLTDKDVEDLEFALTLDIDFVALSFVRRATDIELLRQKIAAANRDVAIVAKIERREALDEFEAILQATDAIMLARGDLGVEMPLTKVPQIQKSVITQCNDLGIPVITATQMLESMTFSTRPTRAEAADVANAVYEGTDALMLSAETASGDFPIEAVRTMAAIAAEADAALADNPPHVRITRMRTSGVRKGRGAFGDAIGQAACRTAEVVEAKRIVCLTRMGNTAALIARYRPGVPITAITLSEEARRRCSLIWGVEAVLAIEPVDTDEIGPLVDDVLLRNGLSEPGETVIIACGMPLAMQTRTNMLKIHTVGESKPA
ncbi:MAG: pyruvate kinase [Candidatus Hydrogenedentales bacterium]